MTPSVFMLYVFSAHVSYIIAVMIYVCSQFNVWLFSVSGLSVTLASPGKTAPPVLWRARRKIGKFFLYTYCFLLDVVNVESWCNYKLLREGLVIFVDP